MDFIGFLAVAFVVLNLIIKAAGKKAKEAKPAQQTVKEQAAPVAPPVVQQMRMELDDSKQLRPRLQPTVQPSIRPHSRPPMEHCEHGTVSAGKPASIPEGMATAMQPPRLVREDLGAQRQRENPNPALTEKWTPPKDEVYDIPPRRKATGKAQAQLRQAMILKEVLDRPISQRKGVRA